MKRLLVALIAVLLVTFLLGKTLTIGQERGESARRIIYSHDAGDWWLQPYAGLAWYGRELQGPRLEACFYNGVVLSNDGQTLFSIGNSILEIPPEAPVLNLVSRAYHPGYADGPADLARLGGVGMMGIGRMASDLKGGYYIADWGNQCIRRLYKKGGKNWWVDTVAGEPAQGPGWSQWRDGTLKTARFLRVQSLAVDSKGNLIVLDSNRIRYVDLLAGTVTTLNPDWGSKGDSSGFEDGPLATAKFNWIMLGCCDIDREKDILYVADSWNKRARKVDLEARTVTTIWQGKPNKRTHRDGPFGEATAGPCHDVQWDPFRKRLVVKEMDCQVLRVLDFNKGEARSWIGTYDRERKNLIRAGKVPYPMRGSEACLDYVMIFNLGEKDVFLGALGKPPGGGVSRDVFSVGRLFLKEN